MLELAAPPDRLALRACRLFETSDAEEARERISRVMQPHGLRLEGRLEGPAPRFHMDFLRLRGVGLGTIAFGPASIEVPPLDGYHLLVLCLSGGAVLRAGGAELVVDRERGALCPAGQPLSGRFSADCEQLILRIDRDRLLTFTGGRMGRLAAPLDLRSARLRPWLSVLRGLAGDADAVRLIGEDQSVAADYEQLLLRLLLAGQEEAAPARDTVRPAALRRALGFLQARATEPLTLADIATAAGVPERTLHEAFRRHLGTTPLRHLRDLRLDRARARLRAGGEGVTEAALAVGFTHLSRFAGDYVARFGERPSETLRRG
ncbi:AraC family transcriptional regulator [Pararoseomonas indoligenes]|uniref:Helix-turn-helix domain-containing protein n=1 Tax=Roseomonas indoligenes TaxID=2820811 RepID=A0A940MPL6_9PROT|nr:AraC family transcriptional regulator [Pararoseomonas indoligenes]MBP0491179.1 helix-turn-helix domain-containing protein [Pararoseomonas indoligenes]